jgi:oligosaccharide repeat unit polymerase
MVTIKKVENFLLWGIRIPVFLIPFLPLYVSSSMVFPYITGKNFAFRILVELAAALWLGLISINKGYRLKNSIIVLSVFVFTFVVGLADLLGVNSYNSFWSNYERMEGYITILHLSLYFMIVRSIFKTKKDWQFFLKFFIAASIIVSLFAFLLPVKVNPGEGTPRYVMEYGTRIHSTIGNPPFLASYLLLSVFLCFILIFNAQKKYLKYIYCVPVVLNSVVIYFTASRGAILAGIIGVIVFCLVYTFKKTNTQKEKLYRNIAISILVLFIISITFLGFFKSTDFFEQNQTLSRFTTMFSDQSVKTRLNAWNMAWNGIQERPILGWGQENFIGIYTVNHIPFGRHTKHTRWLDRAHNVVLDWLINAGILGLFSYLALFGAVFYILSKTFIEKRIRTPELVIVTTFFIVYFIQNLFTFDTINTYIIFFSLLAYVDNLKYSEKTSHEVFNIVFKKQTFKFITVTLLSLVFFSTFSYFTNFKPMRESQLSKQISIKRLNSFVSLRNEFEKALSLNTFGDSDLRRKMVEVSRYIINNKLFTIEGGLKLIQKTTEEVEKLIEANRYNLEYLSFLIKFYVELAFYEPSFIKKAESLIKESMRINPEYEWLYIILAENYVLKKEYENAYVTIRNIVDKDPDNDVKQMQFALVAIRNSREDVAKKALENVKKLRAYKNDGSFLGKENIFSVLENQLIAEAYLEIKNYKKALHYLKEKIRLAPNRADFHFQTVEIYLALGDKENAIKEAKKAAELDSSKYTEISKELINSINNINY